MAPSTVSIGQARATGGVARSAAVVVLRRTNPTGAAAGDPAGVAAGVAAAGVAAKTRDHTKSAKKMLQHVPVSKNTALNALLFGFPSATSFVYVRVARRCTSAPTAAANTEKHRVATTTMGTLAAAEGTPPEGAAAMYPPLRSPNTRATVHGRTVMKRHAQSATLQFFRPSYCNPV
jgi:hypothetical protein